MNRFALNAVAALTILTFPATALAQVAQSPTLKIVTPGVGQTIYGNKVPVLMAPENFEIVDYQKNTTAKAGQGHIHLWLDDQKPTPESAAKVTADTFTFSDVAYGEHTLRAELVDNTHKSLKPPQVVTVKFKNEQITAPSPVATSGFDKNTALVILVVVTLVIVAAWWYTKEEDEEVAKSTSAPRKTTKRSKSGSKR